VRPALCEQKSDTGLRSEVD